MTISEMIKRLEKFPPDTPVVCLAAQNDIGQYELAMSVTEMKVSEYSTDEGLESYVEGDELKVTLKKDETYVKTYSSHYKAVLIA